MMRWGKRESVAQSMAWEERTGKSYYYQKCREGGQVVSQYIGTGYLATLAAQLDQIEQQRQVAERRILRRLLELIRRERPKFRGAMLRMDTVAGSRADRLAREVYRGLRQPDGEISIADIEAAL
jgi:hypothetical protein